MKKLIIDYKSPYLPDIESIRKIAQGMPLKDERGALSALQLLDEIPCLWLKDGFVLRAYGRKDFYGAISTVWAVPEKYADEKETEGVPFARIPRPLPKNGDFTDAFDMCEEFIVNKPKHGMSIMEAVDGDHTLISYVFASIFAREVLEIGAFWHGVAWGFHTILLDSPWNMRWEEEAPSPKSAWEFFEKRPDMWVPVVYIDGDEIVVRFYTYSPMDIETIYEFEDTYRKGSYVFEWSIRGIAEGSLGLMM